MTESDVQNGAAERQKAERRQAFIIAWTNGVILVCFLLYFAWEWHVDAHPTWQHWLGRLISLIGTVWIIDIFISRRLAE